MSAGVSGAAVPQRDSSPAGGEIRRGEVGTQAPQGGSSSESTASIQDRAVRDTAAAVDAELLSQLGLRADQHIDVVVQLHLSADGTGNWQPGQLTVVSINQTQGSPRIPRSKLDDWLHMLQGKDLKINLSQSDVASLSDVGGGATTSGRTITLTYHG